MSETATVTLPDGTILALIVDDEHAPTLVLMKSGQTVSVSGEQAMYKMLQLVTAMPWGSEPL